MAWDLSKVKAENRKTAETIVRTFEDSSKSYRNLVITDSKLHRDVVIENRIRIANQMIDENKKKLIALGAKEIKE